MANGLILSAIWYFIALWAGDFGFFNQIQHLIEAFVWDGRSRVARNTVTQPKAKGGLGIILIVEQYRSMVGNLMLWVLRQDPHPLRNILSSHLCELSMRRWGFLDYTWVVTKGGKGISMGSGAWKNCCAAWAYIKSFINRRKARNDFEWRLLPLWSPHLNHR